MDSLALIRRVPRWLCCLTALLFTTQIAAESTLLEDGEETVARASVDFKIIIPKVLFLALGTASSRNVLPVRLAGNDGTITLTATSVGAINDGASTIGRSQIKASSSDASNLPHPIINELGGATVALSSGKITDRAANWTYRYADSAELVPDGYSATASPAGGVTYTAYMQ